MFDGDGGVVHLAGMEVGLLDCVNDARIPVRGWTSLTTLTFWGCAVAVDGEGESDLESMGMKDWGRPSGKLDGDGSDEGGGGDSGADAEVGGGAVTSSADELACATAGISIDESMRVLARI